MFQCIVTGLGMISLKREPFCDLYTFSRMHQPIYSQAHAQCATTTSLNKPPEKTSTCVSIRQIDVAHYV